MLLLGGAEFRVGVGAVADQDVAAGGERGEETADQVAGQVVVHDVAEDAAEDECDGLVEVEGLACRLHYGLGLVEVGVQVGGGALGAADEQGLGVGEDQRVVVDVDHPALGGHALGELVGVVDGGQARADVEELADAGVRGEIGDTTAQEGAEGAGVLGDLRERRLELLGGLLVDRVVVLAAQPVVPDPG